MRGPQQEITGSRDGILRASAQTARALEQSEAVAILVGSYDGSGNYGDIAQLDAALGVLGRLDADFLVLPMVEQQFAATHQTLVGELIHRPEHVLYFDAGDDPGGEGLTPVEIPAGVTRAVTYLYGGGFLNPSWGERKLAMLKAVEDLVAGSGRVTRIASGQQVDRDWIDTLAPADARLLRRFEILGGRDDDSSATLAGLGARGPALNTGDDAVGILTAIGAAEKLASPDSPVKVNVHFAEHEWVTDLPGSIRDFDLRFLAELSNLTERHLRVQPLLAYLDPRVDESAGLETFAAACAELGAEVAEPLVLRPANLTEVAAELGDAGLTLSSSYHVALTSLLLAVPAAILRDNEYYAQKARGLLSDFGLPPDFSPRSTDDPVLAARAIAPHLLDPQLSELTRRGLEAAAAKVRQRRADAEAKLLSVIAGENREADDSRHRISSVRRGDGELAFDAELQGIEPKQIWLRTSSKVDPSADAALAIALMPAMRNGGTLALDAAVSPRVLRLQREFQGIQRAWSREWTFGDPPLRDVAVTARLRSDEVRPRTGRVAAFFSGGVDSFSTILGDDHVTDLIFVRGLDILEKFTHQDGLAEWVESRLRGAAEELGMPLHVVDTNLRDLSEATGATKPLARWETYYNSALAAVALFLEPLFDRVLISTEFAYENQPRLGSSWMVDQLWGTENLEIFDAGGSLGRVGRIERIAAHPVVQKTLRVCWQNPGGAYNCGRCRKCLLTMATLESIGQLQHFETFPPGIDFQQLAAIIEEVRIPPHLAFCEETLEAIRLRPAPDLEEALAELVASGRRKLGFDDDPVGYAERRASKAESKLREVLDSRSWKITEPLRRLTARRHRR
ncbi:MAG TPA: polysaccharide pyruvyl transferase family protein [Solirubrobacterales bacterium]|nr:polysaccharide pyruvyl transferase family protein [Solirubrobacterales bacterium]